jgi:hypothetical protein
LADADLCTEYWGFGADRMGTEPIESLSRHENDQGTNNLNKMQPNANATLMPQIFMQTERVTSLARKLSTVSPLFFFTWTELPLPADIHMERQGRLPRPEGWDNGSGGLRPDNTDWAIRAKDYAFVDKMESLQHSMQSHCNMSCAVRTKQKFH